MKSGHYIAAVVTLLAVVLFLAAKRVLHYDFGLRTWWPAFAVLYMLVWYYVKVAKK